MPGAISDLSISKDGKVVMVATSPDHDIATSARQYLISRVSASGKIQWGRPVKSPTKEIDVSADGTLVVFINYANQLTGMNARGKELWSVQAMCRPIILSALKKIICYHDDDGEPKVGFDLFDWSGKKISSYPIQTDILALKVAEDEKRWAIGLAEGQVIYFGEDLRPAWTKQVSGEIVDVSVSSGENPTIAVLYKTKKKTQEIILFDSKGESQGLIKPSFRSLQVEMAPQGKFVFYYGNSADGQYVGSASLETYKEIWRRGGAIASDYSYSISVSSDLVLMGYEDITPSDRRSHLLAFEYDGKMKWDLPLSTDEGAYIYTHRIAAHPSVLAVGTDDAQVSVFSFK
jgi:hypothetical protein